MIFLKTFILIGILFACLVQPHINSENINLVCNKNECSENIQKNRGQDYSDIFTKEGDLINRVILALEYDGWINEPLEDVFNKFKELYADPLLSEIMQSVSEFREIPTSWLYSYKVDSVYLVAKEDEKTYLIANVLEILNDEVVDELVMLVVFNRDFKIVDKQFLY